MSKNFKDMVVQVLAAMAGGLGIGLILWSLNLVNKTMVFNIALMAAVWDIICQLKLRDSASKRVLKEIGIGVCMLGVFLWLRLWLGWLLDFPVTGVPRQLLGQRVDGLRGSDVMLELFFVAPGLLLAYGALYSPKVQKWMIGMAFVAFISVFLSYRLPTVPDAIKAVGSNLHYVPAKAESWGLAGSTEEITLAKDIKIGVVYFDSDGKVTSLLDAYDGTEENDAAKLGEIAERFKAGQKLLKLAGTRVVDNVQLQQVQQLGPAGNFIGGLVLLVEPRNIVVEASKKPAKPAPAGNLAGRIFDRIVAPPAPKAAPKVRPTATATVTFDPKDPAKIIDSGLVVKVGDTVRYSGVMGPFETTSGDRFDRDVTCRAYKEGVIKLCRGTGEIKIDVIPEN